MNGVTTALLSPAVTRWKWKLCENAECCSGTERPYASLLYPWPIPCAGPCARTQAPRGEATHPTSSGLGQGWQFDWGGSLL